MDGEPEQGAILDRAILGPADVSDDALASMVAEDLGVSSVELVSCHAEVAEYDLDALTTAGRYRVHGTARHPAGISPYSFFVKVVQSWTRSPQFERVPESFREAAAASLPWRTGSYLASNDSSTKGKPGRFKCSAPIAPEGPKPLDRVMVSWHTPIDGDEVLMSNQNAPPGRSGATGGAPRARNAADRAYRRAWWSLALYPVSFGAAFVIGDGILSALTQDPGDAALWEVLVAAIPALLIFVVPGILAVAHGRRAMKLGRREGKVPAVVGAVIGIAFVGQNLAAYLVGLVTG